MTTDIWVDSGVGGVSWDKSERGQLTPMQRLRQLEPSWLRNGQTTSLLASVIENEEVRDVLGGILNTVISHHAMSSRAVWRSDR